MKIIIVIIIINYLILQLEFYIIHMYTSLYIQDIDTM